MTLQDALALIRHAQDAATEAGVCIAAAVVDAGGNLVAFQRMDGTQLGSTDLAIRKAETSLAFGRPTAEFERALNGGNAMIATLPNVVAAGGGHPVVVGGVLVGALGVSGGEGEMDGRLVEMAMEQYLVIG